MSRLEKLQAIIGPAAFSRVCLLFGAVWMLMIYPAVIWLCPDKLPREMTPQSRCDFYQYYEGAVAVRYGLWDALYPTDRPGVFDQPNHFVPAYRTFLFNPDEARTNLVFYPEFSLATSSVYSPKLESVFPEIKDSPWHYIYPPPTALLYWPLSFFSFDRASSQVWPTLCIWFLFIAAWQASRIHRLLRQGDSYTEGFIILACLFFYYRGRTDITAGNVTPLISGLIGVAIYALLQKRFLAFSCVYIPMILFKSIGLTWLPLLFLRRAYWRTLIYLSIITCFLNGVVLAFAGVGPYQNFLSLLPKISVPIGLGIVSELLSIFGFYPHKIYLFLNLACLATLYYGYYRSREKAAAGFPSLSEKDNPLVLVALLAGTMAFYCLINFAIWPPYCPNYLFFPFLGWILQEGYLAIGRWRYFILGGTLLSFFIFTGEWEIKSVLFHLFGAHGVSWYSFVIFQPFFILFIPLLFLSVAYRRLYMVEPQFKRAP